MSQKKINSKDKGARGEREFAKMCRDQGFKDARRGQQFSGIEGDDVVGLPNIHIECKWVEKLNVRTALDQSIRDAKSHETPIVAHKMNNKPWLVTMLADDFFRLYKGEINGEDNK